MSEGRSRRLTVRGVLIGFAVAFVSVATLGWIFANIVARTTSQKRWKTHEEARMALQGSSPDQTVRIAGRPDIARGDAWGAAEAEWVYFNRVWNRATDRHDRAVTVRFAGGRASHVEVKD